MTVATSNGPRTLAVELGITGLENGRVTATAKRYTKDFCNGRYAMDGTYEGNVLTLKPKQGEGPAGCAIELTMTRDGNTLTGAVGDGTPIKLSK
jgi:hypothetical protein